MRFPPLVSFHIYAGLLGILSGAVAMVFRKGSRGHRLSGNIFFLSTLGMSGSGAFLAFMRYRFRNDENQIVNVFAGLLTFYLVATAWWAARRREGETSIFDWGALLVVAALGACYMTFGLEAASSQTGLKDGYPALLYFIFASVALLSSAGDLRMLLRGGVSGAQRIARHLWRMSFALFIAAVSFFLGQQKVMPASWRGAKAFFVPPLLVLILMIYWLFRVRFKNAFRDSAAKAKKFPFKRFPGWRLRRDF
jgi:uncharacterized membrane protein